MRYLNILATSLLFLSSTVSAQWKKINDVDYVWGPFTIYNLSLFSETGEYSENTRPIMLSLKYMKPVDGRDFAISLARSWENLGITLPEQDSVVDRLRKIMPNIKKGDQLSYIALDDRGYFILNDTIIDEEFNSDFNNAVVAVWLDPRVEIGKALRSKQQKIQEMVKPSISIPNRAGQAVNFEQDFTKNENAPQSAVEKEGLSELEKDAPKIEQNSPKSIENSEPADKKISESKEESIDILPLGDPVLLPEQPLG